MVCLVKAARCSNLYSQSQSAEKILKQLACVLLRLTPSANTGFRPTGDP